MKEDLVSIIIPAFNVGAYISRGIKSCMEQTYQNIEILIVDDGSEDNTWDVIQNYVKRDGRVKALHQFHKGVSVARNEGLIHSKGEYIIFLDSDDWLEKDAVKYLMQQKGARENVIAACDYYCVKNENGVFKRKRHNSSINLIFLTPEEIQSGIPENKYCALSACFKLWPKNILKNVFFDSELYNGEDGLFVFQAVAHAEGMVFSTEPKWNVFFRNGSTTRSEYSHNMLTAITAVEKMMALNQNSNIWPSIIEFSFLRLFGQLNLALISSDVNKRDIAYIKKKIKHYTDSGIFYFGKFRIWVNAVLVLCLPFELARFYRKSVVTIRKKLSVISRGWKKIN